MTLVFVKDDSPQLYLNGPWTTLEPSNNIDEYNIFFVYSWGYLKDENECDELALLSHHLFPNSNVSTLFREVKTRNVHPDHGTKSFLYVIELVSRIKIYTKDHELQNIQQAENSESYIQHQLFNNLFKSRQISV
jgi:hypothetical protein